MAHPLRLADDHRSALAAPSRCDLATGLLSESDKPLGSVGCRAICHMPRKEETMSRREKSEQSPLLKIEAKGGNLGVDLPIAKQLHVTSKYILARGASLGHP